MNAPVKHTSDITDAEESLALQEAQSVVDSESATEVAMSNTLLTPRFYTTDFDEMDAIDVSPVRKEWDQLIAQMVSDPNKGHFKKTMTGITSIGTIWSPNSRKSSSTS